MLLRAGLFPFLSSITGADGPFASTRTIYLRAAVATPLACLRSTPCFIPSWRARKLRLQAIATPLVPNMEKVQIIPPPKDVDPRVLAWKGAAVLGKMDGVADLWVTAADWVSVQPPVACVICRSLPSLSPAPPIFASCAHFSLSDPACLLMLAATLHHRKYLGYALSKSAASTFEPAVLGHSAPHGMPILTFHRSEEASVPARRSSVVGRRPHDPLHYLSSVRIVNVFHTAYLSYSAFTLSCDPTYSHSERHHDT